MIGVVAKSVGIFMSSWKKGTTLNNGQYTIESVLLRSGFGLCYRGRDLNTNKLVTIKTADINNIENINQGDFAEKLIKQAVQVADKCQNPYIVRLYPQVFIEEDQAFMIMDYPEGIDLANFIDTNGKLPPHEALLIITKIASALNVIHKGKCVHLDVKPQNIVIDHLTLNPLLIDYGMVIKLFVLAQKKNQAPINDAFTPPEKAFQEEKLGPYSDIYSLASTLYVLVTGQLPSSVNMRAYQPLIPPKQLNPELCDRTNDAIMAGMAIDIKQRPQYLKDWLDMFKEGGNITESPFAAANITTEETIVQKNNQIIAPPTITKPKVNYPEIQAYTFETVTLVEEKKLFGFVSKINKNFVTTTGQFFIEYLGKGVNLEMVFIPSGEFMMGSPSSEKDREKDESPQHPVKINSFYISKYPITQIQWKTVSQFPKITRYLKHKPASFKGDNYPVERVSWLDAQEFCKRVSKYTGRNYRLPTEAEWEYACRGNTKTPFSFGDVINTEVANYDDENKENKKKSEKNDKKTTPVDNFYPNPFGLYDLHGNVWEWCEDNYNSNYNLTPKDGSAYITSMMNQNRVVRGGSWSLSSNYCRSAKRNHYPANSIFNFIGFRLVCVLE